MPGRARRPTRSRERSADAVLTDVWRYLRRGRRRRRAVTVLVVLALVALALADRSGWLLYDGSDVQRYDGQRFRVVRVVDGDTLIVDAPDPAAAVGERRGSSTTRVRLWGINAPEMARDGRPAEPFAEAATDEARRLAEHTTVTLHLEPDRTRGGYGRLLAFVTLPSGESLGERLLVEGLAHADDRWPHAKLDRYDRLAEQARHDRRGVWAR